MVPLLERVEYFRIKPHINGVHQGNFITNDMINSTTDAILSLEHKWNVYVDQLNNGGIMGGSYHSTRNKQHLNVTVNVLSTDSEHVTVVSHTNGNSVRNVYIGLIQEAHYVGIDNVNDTNVNVEANVTDTIVDETNIDTCTCSDSEDLDDSTFERGDEHS